MFERDGYVASRVEDIALAAGASRATFYLHFKAKSDIARELMGPLRDESETLYRELDTLGDPTWDELHAWVTRAMGYWRRNRAAITVVDEAVAVEPELAGYLVESAQASANAMAGYLARWSGAERETARLRVTTFILQLERVCFLWLVRDVPFDRAGTLTALTDSLYTALHPGCHHPAAERPPPKRD